MINFKFDINGSDIEGNIVKEFAAHMSSAFNKAIPDVKSRVSQLVQNNLQSSPTWQSIISGDVQNLLFIPNAQAALLDISETILRTITVKTTGAKVSSRRVVGDFDVELLQEDYADILSNSNSRYVTANAITIPWLEWMLFNGSQPVVFKSQLISTRKGTLLVRGTDDLAIPSAHAGVQNDNFITKALKPLEPTIGKIIEEEVARRS